MPSPRSRPAQQSGQILAIFALALVAIVAMVGLVVDGGFTFVQKRDQQNVADAAAMAAAIISLRMVLLQLLECSEAAAHSQPPRTSSGVCGEKRRKSR